MRCLLSGECIRKTLAFAFLWWSLPTNAQHDGHSMAETPASPLTYLILLAIAVGASYLFAVLRTRHLRGRQVMLQLKVKQKTQLLQREKEEVETYRLILEQKNKDITDSINYAKQIQDSLLPPQEMLEHLFGEDYFVAFKPKDIVSGDFYWAASLKVNENNKQPLVLAAVVDCTGHGVPGAFLSIMANDFLKQSIIAEGVSTPDEILNFLNSSISSHLNQSPRSQIRDGMDIAIAAIDRAKRKLYFSGANNPVYIYRKTNGVLDQIILTATKQAIGYVEENQASYALREYNLLPGDVIYLFSDGYADQFGGDLNKKLTYKRFREILAEAYELTMPAQRDFLLKRFEAWRGLESQTDDVCVMGIRIS